MPCDVNLLIMRRRLESFVPQTGQLHSTRLRTLEIWVCHMQSPGQSDHHYYGLRTTASVIRRARVVIIFANDSRAVQNVNRRWAAKSRRACVLLFLCSQNFAGLSRFSPFFWRSCWRWSLWKGNLSKQIEIKQIEIHAQIQQNRQETRNRKFEVATRCSKKEKKRSSYATRRRCGFFVLFWLCISLLATGYSWVSRLYQILNLWRLQRAVHVKASPCSEQKIKNPWRSLCKLLSCASSSAWTIRSCVLHVTISCVLHCHAESVSEATSKAFLRDNCRSSLIPGSVNLELISSASSRSLVWRRSLKIEPYRPVRKCYLPFQNSLQYGIRRTYAQAFFIHCKACCMAIQSWDSSASHNILKSQHLHHQTCFRCAPWELGNCNNIMAIASSHEKSP